MTLQEKDKKYIWHPYTHQKNRMPAVPVVSGKKAVLIDEHGNEFIDAVSSWWVNIHGHGNKYIAKKIYEQAKKFQQVIFTGFTHEPAVSLAEKLLSILPGDFSKIFYSDNGSTSTEVAIKMAIQYWINEGQPQRNKVLAFHNAYHGDTFGAMSISERGIYTLAFRDKLFEVIFIDTPDENNIDRLQAEIGAHKNEIACFIYEPLLQGAGLMTMYEAVHLDAILRFVKASNIICIADEVLTGFYRTGKLFAGDYLQEKADIICLSKAITGGTMALGATACTQRIYDAFVSDDKMKTLFHGHSFTGNALACTAALASYDLLMKKSCKRNVEDIVAAHKKFAKRMKAFESKGMIKNLRQTGTIIAFEICTSQQDNYNNKIGDIFTPFCMKRGVYLRSMGNTVYIMPPYCITKKQLKKVYDTLAEFVTFYVTKES